MSPIRKTKLCMFMCLLLMLPMLGNAAGDKLPGTVQVLQSNTIMFGGFNVRYNPAVNLGRVWVSFNPGQSFTISGRDSTTNATFTCQYNANINYDQFWAWETMLSSMSNGAYIGASRVSSTNNTCSSVQVQINSRYMD